MRTLATLTTLTLGLIASSLATGCTKASAQPPSAMPFTVAIAVEGDPGRPVTGAEILRSDKTVATTGTDGRAELTLAGVDGQTIDASIKCPAGHTSPPRPVSIRLARAGDGKAPVVKVSCPPSQRKVVVAIKAENGANLPVVVLGQVITHTDASGAAHFAIDAVPGGQFDVLLDTSGKENARLKPQSPSRPFTVGQSDDIFIYDQKFDVEKKKRARHAKAKPTGPECIGCAT